ncbi:Ulp1 protease family, carboxy-terminal domain protein [Spatholobus suberectus]|nr:Ulp1 protease family, carboxy-terminal domain protein [Spatholobus suberectus]
MFYGKDWMTPYLNLNLIYIPIHENKEHWYLQVICIEERKIYHLDSHLTMETLDYRKDTIRSITKAMSRIIAVVFQTQEFIFKVGDLEEWHICEPRGIPNCGQSDNSAIWVLEWMQMQHSFVSTLYGILDEKLVRMKVALTLLLGNHNEHKKTLMTNAQKNWEHVNDLIQ